MADKRAREQRCKASLKDPFVFSYTIEHLDPEKEFCWTPEEIAGRLPIEHPGYSINTETIYRFIYSSKAKPLKLWLYLRLHRKRRMKHHGRKVQSPKKYADAPSITQRPDGANARLEAGHHETDNMGAPKSDKTGVSVTIERILLVRLHKLEDLKAATKREKLVSQMQQEPVCMQKTMTSDRGPENAEYKDFTLQTGMLFYFCAAYHSWEKGSVENTIGRSRFFIPKGTSVDSLTQEDLNRIEKIMNNTPRKALGFLTPNEVYVCPTAYYARRSESSLTVAFAGSEGERQGVHREMGSERV